MLECSLKEKQMKEGISQEETERLEKLEKTIVPRKQILEEVVFETFIIASNNLKQIMLHITQKTREARVHEWSERE